ncbi:MAG: altronate dehydratase family protein [Caulobacter sp.]|nr:altronate dehydratase family protein [Caulobacter sp.]
MADDPSLAAAVHRVDPRDDVATAVRDIAAGERVGDLVVRTGVPRGHKLAVTAVPAGAQVRKYGFPIGLAISDIAAGDHVHSHNLATGLAGELDYSFTAPATRLDPVADGRTFLGYRRADGRVGTRNEIWILVTVGCVANTARRLAETAAREFAGRVDGIHAFPHPFGCSQLGDDLSATRRMLAALAQHPNAGGVLILGLGCESNQLDALLADIADRSRIRAFTTQDEGDEFDAGLAAIGELVALAGQDRRVPCPLSDLVIGLKCGGSDGFSGLTANPLVGHVADTLAAAGGTPVLTEIPEIFGAEHLLLERAVSRAVFDDAARLVNGFKRHFLDHGQPVHENPSPGNIAGGITTLEEKSLGAVQKAGHAVLTQALAYGERVREPGLALLEAPGNDAVSSTALVAAGATIVLFTTGRGTPLGFPAPTLKIASNTALAERKPRWIDFDAGVVLAGVDRDAAGDALMDLVLATASGQPTRAEENGEREIALWKRGVTL